MAHHHNVKGLNAGENGVQRRQEKLYTPASENWQLFYFGGYLWRKYTYVNALQAISFILPIKGCPESQKTSDGN